MKNNKYTKAILIIFLMSFLNCKSQIVVDMTSDDPVPSNYNQTGQYYEKDVHNYLLPFVGTWEYVNGNEKFQIIMTKITKYHTVVPKLNLNFYEDGIAFQYKKFVNGNLIFESPITGKPAFTSENGLELEGMISDYERVRKVVSLGGGISIGGGHFPLSCHIEKIMTLIGEPQKIKFKFYLGHFGESSGFGEYDNPIYAGQPKFSIPNDIILTKVP